MNCAGHSFQFVSLREFENVSQTLRYINSRPATPDLKPVGHKRVTNETNPCHRVQRPYSTELFFFFVMVYLEVILFYIISPNRICY